MKRFLALIMGALAAAPRLRRRGIPRAADHRDRRLLAGRRPPTWWRARSRRTSRNTSAAARRS